jgi:hypothetical protein
MTYTRHPLNKRSLRDYWKLSDPQHFDKQGAVPHSEALFSDNKENRLHMSGIKKAKDAAQEANVAVVLVHLA